MKCIESMIDANRLFKAGEVLAYPTEAVYGLGCDAFNAKAVSHLLALKKRSQEKGLIVLVADWEQLWPLVDVNQIPEARLAHLKATWPGDVTWVFPKSTHAPAWITGKHDGIAIRMTAHPVAHALCQNGPIVSTSANLEGFPPARDVAALAHFFPEGLAGVVAGALGSNLSVSKMYRVEDGFSLR